jgi:hypothetical protein
VSTGTPEAVRKANRRLTLADAYRDAQHVIDQLTTRAPSEPSASVEISRNAAGNAQVTIKVYALSTATPEEVRAATERAYDEATNAYDTFNTQYPHVDPKAAKGA